tara:strand:- start:439 stop:564 length:126 start_codon:yes stop_codon:yes gene_type:complete
MLPLKNIVNALMIVNKKEEKKELKEKLEGKEGKEEEEIKLN